MGACPFEDPCALCCDALSFRIVLGVLEGEFRLSTLDVFLGTAATNAM